MTTKAIAYLRVSTGKQVDNGLSLEAQRERVQAYAKLYDIELVDIIEDAGASAKTLDRHGLQQALAALKSKKADALIVTKLDRLTRSVGDLGYLVAHYFAEGQSALMSVGEQVDTRTATGRMVLNMIGTIAQWERETISERTKVVMQHKKAKGEYIGGQIPYGFQLVGKVLVPHAPEQSFIGKVKAWRAVGLSLRRIATKLANEGILNRIGKVFNATQIARLCAA